ncbi:hypothetical protein P171DRAFT_460735 [Karstenula rhodostoma CBS 690.94]|uniref:D-lactate dehydrogenase (cytochrome) n=1 Tax=Karstenula rhodostoma CBS 690.94 TaxID=1392251 RepID=A0A9P4PS91_9PLEO|nr:hypothetical protein P171DRAFT_460735 [Karstenula rhodostoma CBS 690.94]
MHQRSRSDAGDISSPRSSRAPSFSSDRPSLAGTVTFQMPSSVRPAPAYIAASVASQIVTDNHNAQLREDTADPDNEEPDAGLSNALFSEQALSLLNAFLDHLLFAFLATARSPSLTAIRPAIVDVLKPHLAREAMATADEELAGLLAGEDDEEFPAQRRKEGEPWDVEKVWKRTRLRIMVYTRLGELEDEDEERYVQQERGLSMDESNDEEAGLVSWASAIFLTSLIEHVAEQTLLISGQAAFTRLSAKMRKMSQQSPDSEEQQLERIIVEEFDVEKVALNSALGRVWRTWRKRVRSPIMPLSPRGIHSMSSYTSLHRRHLSYDTDYGSMIDGVPEVSEYKPTETEIAANIPLPIGDDDIKEIEVPGLARTFEEDESSGAQTPVTRPQRPTSVIMLAPTELLRNRVAKERPVSVPPPKRKSLVIPAFSEQDSEQETDDLPFETPMEAMEATSDDDSYIHDERQEDMHHNIEENGDHEADADMVAFAASTGMGFEKKSTLGKEEDDADTPTQVNYEEGSRVFVSKRMSLEKTGPPGIVRTYSTRSSSLRSQNRSQPNSPGMTPNMEARSFLEDDNSEDDAPGLDAIGVAHTSNIPIPSPSPSTEVNGIEKVLGHAEHPSHGGYVEVPPRQIAPTAIHVRSTPAPDVIRGPEEIPVARKEVQRRDLPQSHVHLPQSRPREVTPPRTRLSSLQETEAWQSKQEHQPSIPEKSARRGSPIEGSPRYTSPHRAREPPVAVAERPTHLKSIEGSPRSRSGQADGPADTKTSLKRVSSSSSSTAGRSVGTSILHSGRESSTSLDGRPRGLSGRMSEEDRQREFDSLVRSDETVKVTLTPQNMRDMDPSSKPPKSSVTVYPRVNADKDSQFGSQHLPARTAPRSSGPIPSPSSRGSMKKPLAREPQVKGDSMRDFADFIRSTGPAPGDEKPVQRFAFSGSGAKPPNGPSSIGGLGRKLSLRQTSSHSHSSSLAGDGPSAKPRIHMEPRSPAGQRSGNDDLIDFIRQGPPNSNNGQPRIPRSVAPFRTTVDSDQFDHMLDNGNVESAYGSQVSTASKQSSQTSNSKTGLIPKQNVTQPAYSDTPQQLSGSMSNAEPQITRTRRRIKDPYAIDSDDEDDDLLTALPASNKPVQREESMMDFLNSMEPTSNSPPQAFMLSPETIAAAKARAAANKGGDNGHSHTSSLTSLSSAPRNGMNGRTGAPQANISTTVASNPPRAGYMPRLQARGATSEPRAGRSATNDLADFLRNSGPPEPPAPAPDNITALIQDIQQAAPSTTYSTNAADLTSTSSTNHSYAPQEQVSKAVFYPKTTEDTSIILNVCHRRKVAVTAYSGGTSLPGALANSRGGVCVHFGAMDRVLGVNEGDLDVRVQPGIGWVELNEYLAPKGLFFPVDPAPGAKIGGMVAMSCSGTNAYRYGTMKEWVISLTAVLSDGTIITTRRRPRKSSAGYDLTHLIIGSEGTLALVTEAVLKITPLPQNLHVGKATFPTLQSGVNATIAILQSGHLLEAIELADKPSIISINHSKLAKERLEETPTLFVKFAGSKETVTSQIAFVKKTCKDNGGLGFEASSNKQRIDVIWGARKCLGNALVTMKKTPTDLFISTDAAVPISAMATLIEETNNIIATRPYDTSNWFCANVGHVGDGNVHTAIVCPVEDKEKAEQVLVEVQRLALRLEGTITGEHGVGLKLRDMLVEEVGEVGVGAMRAVKRALDPRGILNPDKVFRLETEKGAMVGRLEKL